MRLIAFLAVLVLGLAGCLSSTAPFAAPAGGGPAPDPIVGEDGRTYEPNLFLLGQPEPPGTTVSGGAEPVILADKDGQYLWIGDTAGIHRSANGGTSWSTLGDIVFSVNDGFTLAQDGAGRLYAATTSIPYIHFMMSTNDGTVWSTQNIPEVSPIADRPWLAARGDGEVALFIYAYGRGGFSEACSRSTDAGSTWLDRDLFAGSPQAGNAVYDDAGNLYYGDDSGRIYKFSTGSLGKCAGPQQLFQLANGVGAQPMVPIAVGGGAVYMAAPNVGNSKITLWGTQNLATRKSVDISPPDQRSNTFATISYHNGEVAVAWYASETAGDPSNPNFAGSWNVYVARVANFWTASPTVAYTRLTTVPNHVGDICMGGLGCSASADRDLLDYFGVDHGPDGVVHVAYGHDGTTTATQTRYARVA